MTHLGGNADIVAEAPLHTDEEQNHRLNENEQYHLRVKVPGANSDKHFPFSV